MILFAMHKPISSVVSPAVDHTHVHFMAIWTVQDYPGEPVPEPIWILLKQETVSGSGIS